MCCQPRLRAHDGLYYHVRAHQRGYGTKTIRLIGGMSWESTAEYYRILNRRIAERCGGLHSAKVVLYSVDSADIEARQRQADWTSAGEVLADAARQAAAARASGDLRTG